MNDDSIDFAVVQGRNVIMKGEAMKTADFPDPTAVIEEIASRLLALKVVFPTVKAVGMGLTGFADSRSGTVHSLTNVAGWNDIPIRRILTEISGLPAFIDNDAHCATAAEWKFGAGQGFDDLVCIWLGRGVGSGIIADGRFLRGSNGVAGEIGQSSINYSGRIGHYGNRGAIENYVGTCTIARDARITYAAAGIARTEAECSPLALAEYAKMQCPIALQIWDKIAKKLSTSLANCVYMLNPEAVIMGGELAEAGEILLTPLRHHLKAQLFYTHYDNLQIIPAELDHDAGIIGAAHLAAEYLLSENADSE